MPFFHLVLWCVPRSVSTAFERVFIERADCTVLHEPLSVTFYYSKNRKHSRYAQVSPKPEYEASAVLAKIAAVQEVGSVFIKDLAYHLRSIDFNLGLLPQFTHTFLIRHPLRALLSLHRLLPDFDLEETGYSALRRLFDQVKSDKDVPVVVDGDIFRACPHDVMREYCRRVGIKFMPSSLTWKRRDIPEWNEWRRWHEEALQSEGIVPPSTSPVQDIPHAVKRALDPCLDDYRYLSRFALRPPFEQMES